MTNTNISLVNRGRNKVRAALLLVVLAAWPLAPGAQEPAPAAQQDVMYVNDQLYIAVRTAPSTEAENIKVIPSGTRLLVLERDEQHGFYRVRLDSGEEGWVLSRFLTDTPIARQRLAEAQAAAARLQAERDRLQEALTEARAERDRFEARARELEQQNAGLAAELEEIRTASAGALELNAENRRLQAELDEARKGQREAEARAEATRGRLYTVATIAALLGLAIGFYIGYTPVRREKKWRRLP